MKQSIANERPAISENLEKRARRNRRPTLITATHDKTHDRTHDIGRERKRTRLFSRSRNRFGGLGARPGRSPALLIPPHTRPIHAIFMIRNFVPNGNGCCARSVSEMCTPKIRFAVVFLTRDRRDRSSRCTLDREISRTRDESRSIGSLAWHNKNRTLVLRSRYRHAPRAFLSIA